MGSHPSTSSKRSQWEPKPDDIGKYAVEFGAAVAEQVIGYEIPDPVLHGVKIAGQVAKNTAICMDAHHNWVRTQNRYEGYRLWVKDGFCATFEVELGEAPPFGRT